MALFQNFYHRSPRKIYVFSSLWKNNKSGIQKRKTERENNLKEAGKIIFLQKHDLKTKAFFLQITQNFFPINGAPFSRNHSRIKKGNWLAMKRKHLSVFSVMYIFEKKKKNYILKYQLTKYANSIILFIIMEYFKLSSVNVHNKGTKNLVHRFKFLRKRKKKNHYMEFLHNMDRT